MDISIIDSYLSQNGQFCFLDWLMTEDFIAYDSYEAWRNGKLETLDESISLPKQELEALIEQGREVFKKLNLISERQSFYRWGGSSQSRLKLSNVDWIDQELANTWSSSKDELQMDLFMDNTAVILENQVLDGLINRDFNLAKERLQQLSGLNPESKKLGGYSDLINYGLHILANPSIPFESMEAEFNAVDHEVAPLAKELLGAKQRDFLAFSWRRIADNLSKSELDTLSIQQQLQWSYALMQIPDWKALQLVLEKSEVLYESAELMERLTHAYSHTKQTALFVLMWGILFERYPESAKERFSGAGTYLLKDWEGFLSFDDEWSESYFLAYLLIRQPGIIHSINRLPACKGGVIHEPVNQQTFALVKSRLEEDDEKPYRAELKKLCPAMLNCYLNKRDWQASIRKRY